MVSIEDLISDPGVFLGIFWFFNVLMLGLMVYKKVSRLAHPIPKIESINEKYGTVKTIFAHSYLKNLLVTGQNITNDELVDYVYNEIMKSIALAFHLQTRRLKQIHESSDRVVSLFRNQSVRQFLLEPHEWEKNYYTIKRRFFVQKVRQYDTKFISDLSSVINAISWELQFRRTELYE